MKEFDIEEWRKEQKEIHVGYLMCECGISREEAEKFYAGIKEHDLLLEHYPEDSLTMSNAVEFYKILKELWEL